MDGKQGGRLAFGCVRLGSISGGGSSRRDERLVRHAIDAGITLFDTADAYGNGTSERVLGRALRGRRSEVDVATKVGYVFRDGAMATQKLKRSAYPFAERIRRRHPASASAPTSGHSYHAQDFSASYIRGAVEASLRRLGTDYIDVCQLHAPALVVLDAVEEIDALIRSGKVRRFGIGAEKLSAAADWLSVDLLSVVQVPFGLLDPQAADQIFGSAAGLGVEVWARGVYGGGLFAAAEGGRSPSGFDSKAALVRELERLAERHHVTVFQLALDYVRSFGGVSAILLGINSEAHLLKNTALWDSPHIDDAVLAEAAGVVARWYDQTARGDF